VCPDQYVAHVLPLDIYAELEALFDAFMVRSELKPAASNRALLYPANPTKLRLPDRPALSNRAVPDEWRRRELRMIKFWSSIGDQIVSDLTKEVWRQSQFPRNRPQTGHSLAQASNRQYIATNDQR